MIILFAIIMAGIWGTAVYTSHHYIIDVTLGICCALLGILLFEKGLMKTGWFKTSSTDIIITLNNVPMKEFLRIGTLFIAS